MKRIFLCGTCNEFKTLEMSDGKFVSSCPTCGDELEEVDCSNCSRPAVRVEEWMESGPTARMPSQAVCEPRCGLH